MADETTPRDCPICASAHVALMMMDDEPQTLAVHCYECGATGEYSISDDPAHAVTLWNLECES